MHHLDNALFEMMRVNNALYIDTDLLVGPLLPLLPPFASLACFAHLPRSSFASLARDAYLLARFARYAWTEMNSTMNATKSGLMYTHTFPSPFHSLASLTCFARLPHSLLASLGPSFPPSLLFARSMASSLRSLASLARFRSLAFLARFLRSLASLARFRSLASLARFPHSLRSLASLVRFARSLSHARFARSLRSLASLARFARSLRSLALHRSHCSLASGRCRVHDLFRRSLRSLVSLARFARSLRSLRSLARSLDSLARIS